MNGNTRLEAPVVEATEQTYVKEIAPSPSLSKYIVLEAIAKCESGGRQFNEDGTVLRGKVNPLDVGRFQINEKYHLLDSLKMGLDIHTQAGNTAYAEYLYETQGAKPWSASANCHGFY